ncbi:MAG TPA: hypothetical protein VK525_21450 [Candidatus Saccharimonadales bacterium]|nr:hypothetical protein [Candidatus Saccharimonadales bacterium]
MARYSAFLGRKVEVQYRAGDILLPASGTFVADSGRSIFLEQSFMQRGQHKHFRWEIPYQCIVRLEEKPDELIPVAASSASGAAPVVSSPESSAPKKSDPDPQNSASAAAAGAGSAVVLPLSHRPKIA